jgi:hypothetical protein
MAVDVTFQDDPDIHRFPLASLPQEHGLWPDGDKEESLIIRIEPVDVVTGALEVVAHC